MEAPFGSDLSLSPAPASFGLHPNYWPSYSIHWQNMKEHAKKKRFYRGDTVGLQRLAKAGKVYLIPRDQYLEVVDEWGDQVALDYPNALNGVGIDKAVLPFSSTDFFSDIYEEDYFKEMRRNLFFRLGGINQLGYLVPPRPDERGKDKIIMYTFPQFKHTRWAHCRLTAFLMEAILAKNGFSEKERFPVVLTAAYHDAATPAGGDSIKRVDPYALSEEDNFDFVLKMHGLAQEWKEEYGFDVYAAKQLVKGKGLFGRVLDIVDKMAYTALDCLFVGRSQPCKVRSYGIKHPLAMDVWEDLRFNDDRTDFAFVNPERLFQFLLFRAYEHSDLLMNPYSRALDFFLTKKVKPLYFRGVITKKQLLSENDDWLQNVLRKNYPKQNVGIIIEPEKLNWRKFDTYGAFRKYRARHKTDHIEHIKGFNAGLNFKVWRGNKTASLKEVISRAQIEEIEEVCRQVKGYYVYYAKRQ